MSTAHRVYMQTFAATEAEAVAVLTKRAAEFYGQPLHKVGLVITSAEQAEVTEQTTICDSKPVYSAASFSVEGYAYIRTETRR